MPPASGTGLAQQAAAHLERGEVPGDDDHPAPPARAARCSSPSMRMPRLSASTEPHHARPNSNRLVPSAAKCSRSSASRRPVPFREAQREVGRGDAAAFAQDAAQQRAEDDAPEPALQGPRQARGQPEHADPHHAGQVRG